MSDESGPFEIYVQPFPGPGGKWQISGGGGRPPRWSKDGRELVYVSLDDRLMAVSYTASGDSFIAGKPRVWSETRLLNVLSPAFDLAPDGKHAAVLVNELRRKAPAGSNQ